MCVLSVNRECVLDILVKAQSGVYLTTRLSVKSQ